MEKHCEYCGMPVRLACGREACTKRREQEKAKTQNRIYPNPPANMIAINEWMGHCVAFAHLMNEAAEQKRPMSLIDYDIRTGVVQNYGEVKYSAKG